MNVAVGIGGGGRRTRGPSGDSAMVVNGRRGPNDCMRLGEEVHVVASVLASVHDESVQGKRRCSAPCSCGAPAT